MTKTKPLVLTEYPNLIVKHIWKHPLIKPEQRLNIKNYADNVIDGKINIEYSMKNKVGRLFLKNPSIYSSTAMWNAVRASLFAETEYDIDIVNCHNNILLNIVQEKYDCDNLKYYCSNREDVFENITIEQDAIDKYNDTNNDNKNKKDVVKILFTIILYGGSINTWAENYDFDEDDYELSPFVHEYIDEVKSLCDIIVSRKEYKYIKDIVYEKEKEKELDHIYNININQDKRKKPVVFDPDKFHVSPFKILALILQDIERNIIFDAFEFCKKQNIIITSYNYDGFQVIKKSFKENHIHLLNKYIQNKWGDNTIFIIKPFNKGLDLSLIPLPKPVICSNQFHFIDNYNVKKDYFEQYFAAVCNPNCYVERNIDGYVISKYSHTQLENAFKHLRVSVQGPYGVEKKSFISFWLQDEEIKVFNKLVYKPTPLVPKYYELNTWNGFPIEKVEYKINLDTSIIHEHIKVMAGECNNKLVYEYILNWLAWCVQYPARKTMVCLILYGKTRTGKSCLAENIMETIMGKDKVVIAGSVDQLFDKHSSNEGKHVVVLNEAQGKQTKNIHEIIKDAITRETNIINPKGIAPYDIDDFANYIFTTNNVSSVDLPKDDCRFMPIKVSSSKFGDIQYFKKLRKALADVDIMRSFYQELMDIPLENWNAVTDRPFTEITDLMKEASVSPYEEFQEYIVELNNKEYETNGCVAYYGKELYDAFKTFWSSTGRKADSLPSLNMFGARMKELDGCSYHKSNGKVKYLIIPPE